MKEGYKKTEAGIIPNEWNVKTIGDIFEFKNGLNKEKEFFGKGTKIINYVDVFRNRALDNNIIQGLVEVSEKEKQLFNTKKGDVFFTRTSETVDEIGMTAVLLENINDLVYSGFVLRARPKTEELDLFYKKYCFSEFYTRKEIMRKSSCTTRALTSGTLLKDVLIKIPTIKEQQKIADILSTVDTQIDDTDKLIEKTKELKKGLMQRLLTKGIGHTEFKMTEVGEIPVEWEIITVGKLVTLLKSGLSRSLKEENVGVPCIRSNNIKEDKLVLNDLKYWYNMDDKGAKIEDYILDEGDIIVNFINSISQIGKGCIFNKNDFRTIYTTNLLRIKVDNSKIINTFFYYYIQTERYRKEITLITKPAVNQASFTTVEYKSIKFPVPNLEEQRLISNILVSVDTQIEEYENKKSKLEELKKGLMQQLLTGKIRVV